MSFETYMPYIIGAIIGFIPSLIINWLNNKWSSKREERRFQQENVRRRIELATEFYRRFFDPLAPFLRAYYELQTLIAILPIKKEQLTEEERKKFLFAMENLLKTYRDGYMELINKGYLGILPRKLSDALRAMQHQIDRLEVLVLKDPSLSNVTKEQQLEINDLFKNLEQIRDQICIIMNVDALSGTITE